MTTDCKELAREYADDIAAYTDGRMWRDEDGEDHEIAEGEQPGEGWHQLGISDYLDGMLDYRVICARNGDYIAAHVLMAFGGPNVWVNTDTQEVAVYWGASSATWPLPYGAGEEIDAVINELWGCR